MPILHIHGVANRDPEALTQREQLLRRYITDEISDIGTEVPIIRIYWGDKGAKFAWGLQSCPNSSLQMMGALDNSVIMPVEKVQLMTELSDVLVDLPITKSSSQNGELLAPGMTESTNELTLKLSHLTERELSSFATTVILSKFIDANSQQTRMLMAADDVAYHNETRRELAQQPSPETEITRFQELIEERYAELEQEETNLKTMGPGWLGDLADRFQEALRRSNDVSGNALTKVISHYLRPKLNSETALFLGDVLTYLTHRGTPKKPGAIMQCLLDGLAEAYQLKQNRHNEPLVVLSHSMGGQIMYDALTSFLPYIPEYQHIKVDFWCATASQVGLFEEIGLFAASKHETYGQELNKQVPFPSAHLGYWWNVWDANDYISFTAKAIFEEIDDEAYDSGMSMVHAHGGYLQQPSFYRMFAQKLAKAQAKNWSR